MLHSFLLQSTTHNINYIPIQSSHSAYKHAEWEITTGQLLKTVLCSFQTIPKSNKNHCFPETETESITAEHYVPFNVLLQMSFQRQSFQPDTD